MGGLKRSLRDAVRKLAYHTSVDQLKKSGIKKVNVLGIDRIVGLIDEAVNRSLKHRLIAAEREEVIDATKEEFMKLLKSNQDLQRTQEELAREKQEAQSERQSAEKEADRLRLELQVIQQKLEERLIEAETKERARYEEEDVGIDSDIEVLFDELGRSGVTSGDGDEELRGRVRELVLGLVNRERSAARREIEAARNTEFSNMQRRVKKLQRSLDITEKRLDEVSKMKDVEEGIASLYREVQGLDSRDTNHDQKKGLMADIFKANLALQGRK